MWRLLPALLAGLIACSSGADLVYLGGPVLTVDAEDTVAEAVAVDDGRILAVGSRAEVEALRGPGTEVVDLGGRTLAPGFVDAHGHVVGYAVLQNSVDLSPPPWGGVASIPELQEKLRRHLEQAAVPEGEPLLGSGYDDAILVEHRHPTRAELDAVSTRHPIYLNHVSGHLGVANSAALEALGFDADTPDPPGGHLDRDPRSGELSGRLEENAHIPALLRFLGRPSPWEALSLLRDAQQVWFRNGQTTINDGRSVDEMWLLLRFGAWTRSLRGDVVVQPDYDTLKDRLESIRAGWSEPWGRLRVSAVKLTLDGSPQGKTAWLSEPYAVPPEGQGPDYRGYPIYSDAELEAALRHILSLGFTFHAHTNGDASVDQLLRVVRKLRDEGLYTTDLRPVSIHSQTTRPDQLDAFRELGIVPSFYVMHVWAWGDWHRSQVLGAERAARISPAGSALRRGLRFTLSHDAPVTPPDVLRLVWAAVNRTTRSGFVLGADERLSPRQALRAVTIDAAWQYREEDRKGSIEVGKLADLVILSDNPLEIDPTRIHEIRVEETFKEGRSVYRRR